VLWFRECRRRRLRYLVGSDWTVLEINVPDVDLVAVGFERIERRFHIQKVEEVRAVEVEIEKAIKSQVERRQSCMHSGQFLLDAFFLLRRNEVLIIRE
jgi:hypothetical protein